MKFYILIIISVFCLQCASQGSPSGGPIDVSGPEVISIEPHNIFKRSEENLYYELPISIADAALGTTVEVPSIDGGRTKIKIPSGTQSGKQLRLKGKGMPILRRNITGDLYIRIVTEVPTSLTKKQKELLVEFKTLEDTKSNPLIKSFFEKAKKFWIS